MLKNMKYYASLVTLIAPIFIVSIFIQLRGLSLLLFPVTLVIFFRALNRRFGQRN